MAHNSWLVSTETALPCGPCTTSCSRVRLGSAWLGAVDVAPADISLAGDLAVEAGERYGKSLHGTHGVLVVQSENVVRYPAKLHHYVVHWNEEIVEETRIQLQLFTDEIILTCQHVENDLLKHSVLRWLEQYEWLMVCICITNTGDVKKIIFHLRPQRDYLGVCC